MLRNFLIAKLLLISLPLIALSYHFYFILSKPEPYRTLSEKQHVLTVKVPGKRGTIYDRFGRPLAFTGEGLTLQVIDTLSFKDSVLLSRLGININRFKVGERITGLSPFLWDKIKVNGVFKTLQFNKRYLPCGEPCARLIGKTDGIYGFSGVEYAFDSILAPKTTEIKFLRYADGRVFLAPRSIFNLREERADGKDIVLSIDGVLQRRVYGILKNWVSSLNAKGALAIVGKVNTGEILAMTSLGSMYSDRILLYEPGSTFKIVVYTEALERGLNLEERCGENKGYIVIDGITIKDVIPLGDKDSWFWAVVKSSNACAAKLALMMDSISKNGLYRRALLYGFGEGADIGLYEDIPKLEKPSKWRRIKLANVAIGQGILVNPIQVLRAYIAIANDGKYVYPTLLKGDTPRTNPSRVIARKETFKVLKELLTAVVDSGTGRMAKIEGIKVAGKTGTAQKIDPKTGRYSEDKTLASFIGFFPVENPKYIIYVLVDEPENFRTGGLAAAPIFREIALEVLNLYGWDSSSTKP